MNNITIGFYPKRKIIAANPPTDELYYITLTLDTFDRADNDKIKESESVSGIYRASYLSSTTVYSCNSFIDLTDSSSATTEEMEMFLASTLAAEQFEATNLDTDSTMDVKRQGGWNQSRESQQDKNIFGYNFTLRVIQE